tara:strand:+ start:1724 stop:3985 length:2262 start_codon:yes stop_codon:yes gene_type:complete
MSAIAQSTKTTLDLIKDWDAFSSGFSQPCQVDILGKLDIVRQLLSAPRGTKSQLAERLAKRNGISKATVYRYLSHYLKGDPANDKPAGERALTNHARFPRESSGLHPRTISWIEGLFDQAQRDDDGREVHRQILDTLALWRKTSDPKWKVPGYQTPPPNLSRCDHPRGLSARNIQRLKPAERARKLAKQGALAASHTLPPVLTTRVGSAYLARVLFDDQDHDNLITAGDLALAGVKESCRPVSFNSLDFFTAVHLDQHLRAEYPLLDPVTKKTTKKTLTGAEFQWFGIRHLQQFGYRTDALGTELIGEHKTASFWQAKGRTTLGGDHSFLDAIQSITGGHVRLNTSGLTNTPALAGMFYCPQSTGNFKFKTWIESAFRLVRTYMQSVIGQTGSHARLNGPAENYGIQKRERQLISFVQKQNLCDQQACLVGAIIEDAPEYIQKKLQSSLLTLQEFSEVIQGVYRAINQRTDHKLEGWDRCGFTQTIWRTSPDSDQWFAQSELEALRLADPIEHRLILSRINSDPRAFTRSVSLSPHQAQAHCSEADRASIASLPDQYVGMLLPLDMAQEVTVSSTHCFSLPNPLWRDTKDLYVASIKKRHGNYNLQAGHQLLVFADPFGDGKAHLYDRESTTYLGTIYQTVAAANYDHQAKIEQLGVRNELRANLDAPQHARARQIAAERTALELRNTRIMKGEESDPQQRRKDSASRGQITRRKNQVEAHAGELDTVDLADLAEVHIPEPETADEDFQNPFI